MMTPTTAELRTAIAVLHCLGQRLQEHNTHSCQQLPRTDLGDQYAAHLTLQTAGQTRHLEAFVQQLQNWRHELLQTQKSSITQTL